MPNVYGIKDLTFGVFISRAYEVWTLVEEYRGHAEQNLNLLKIVIYLQKN